MERRKKEKLPVDVTPSKQILDKSESVVAVVMDVTNAKTAEAEPHVAPNAEALNSTKGVCSREQWLC